MKSRFVVSSLFVTLMSACVLASSSRSLVLAPNSSLWLVGDSTLHPFTCRTTQFQVSGSSPSITAILQQKALKTFDVVIPVTSLKSKESALDKNMYRALKADQCPAISFHLASYEVFQSTGSENRRHVKASGTLSIACQEQPVMLETDLTPGPEILRVQGQYTLLMTDYGVKPPSLMMGTIKVKNPVVIHFDLQLGFAN